jgi:hypothetical protein
VRRTAFHTAVSFKPAELTLPRMTARSHSGISHMARYGLDGESGYINGLINVKRSFRLPKKTFVMGKLLALAALLLLSSVTALAQGMPAGEVGAGYTFRSYGLPAILQPPLRLSMNGWNVTADYNVVSRLGIAWDLDWTDNSSNGIETDIATTTIGPQIYPFGHHKLTPFAHALIGAGRFYYRHPCPCAGAGASSNHFSQYDFAWVAGGGIDYTVRPNVGIRVAEFDFEQVNFGLQRLGRGPMPAQNNWKYSAAILLRF